jgi:hypothetical protein
MLGSIPPLPHACLWGDAHLSTVTTVPLCEEAGTFYTACTFPYMQSVAPLLTMLNYVGLQNACLYMIMYLFISKRVLWNGQHRLYLFSP